MSHASQIIASLSQGPSPAFVMARSITTAAWAYAEDPSSAKERAAAQEICHVTFMTAQHLSSRDGCVKFLSVCAREIQSQIRREQARPQTGKPDLFMLNYPHRAPMLDYLGATLSLFQGGIRGRLDGAESAAERFRLMQSSFTILGDDFVYGVMGGPESLRKDLPPRSIAYGYSFSPGRPPLKL